MSDIAMQTEIEKIEDRALTLRKIADLVIIDETGYLEAVDAMKSCKALLKAIDDTFRGPIEAAHKAHKAILAASKQHSAPIEEIEAKLRKSSTAWATAQEAKRREEERKAREEAEAKQRKAEEEAAALRAANETLGISEPVPEPVVVYDAPVFAPAAKVEGVTYRDVWKYEIVDPVAIPREYLTIDETKIGGVVRSLKNLANIPGVRVYSEKTAVVR